MSRQWMCKLERCSGGSGGPQLLYDHGDDLGPSDPAETGPSQVLHAAHVNHEIETFLFFSSLSCLMSADHLFFLQFLFLCPRCSLNGDLPPPGGETRNCRGLRTRKGADLNFQTRILSSGWRCGSHRGKRCKNTLEKVTSLD